MDSKDSYPPSEPGDSSRVSFNDFSSKEDFESDKDSKSENFKEEHLEDIKEDVDVDSNDEEVTSWDGSEAEIVVDDETEEYEEEDTGVKIKYSLKPNEVKDFIENSEGYAAGKKAQRKHIVIQFVIFVGLMFLGFLYTNKCYMMLSLLPIISIFIILLMPYIGVKRLVKDILKTQDYSVEIFSDKIEINTDGMEREILLDGSCESSELNNMIFIFSKKGLDLIIPLRAVEPEFRADVQAMILAGTKPKYKD